MLAYCGLICDSCPIYLATLEPDRIQQKTMRSSIAELCSNQYGMNLLADDINDCDGCKTNTGRIFSSCVQCEIRTCAKQRDLDSCGLCSDYACNKLELIFKEDSGAKYRLDEIKKRPIS